MKKRSEKLILAAVVLAGSIFFLYWLFHNPVRELYLSVPGLDNRPPVTINPNDSVIIGERFQRYDSTFTSSLTGTWPNFRGPGYDNISTEPIGLLEKWPESGPDILWKKELGEGHAGAAIHNGRVYVLDYDERRKYDMLHCYSLTDGTELWRRYYSVNITT